MANNAVDLIVRQRLFAVRQGLARERVNLLEVGNEASISTITESMDNAIDLIDDLYALENVMWPEEMCK